MLFGGIGYCLEECGIFVSFNVEENLMLLLSVGKDGMSFDEIYCMFLNLKEVCKCMGMWLFGGE